MKKLILLLAIFPIIFFSCSNDEGSDDNPNYCTSESQKKALKVFNGTFADIQFSNLSEAESSHLLPDPDKIIFKTQYKEPLRIDANIMTEQMSEAFGECIYHGVSFGNSFEDTECYYYVSCGVDEFILYYKGGENDKKKYKRFGLSIKSETKFNLQDKAITLPYIFVKQ